MNLFKKPKNEYIPSTKDSEDIIFEVKKHLKEFFSYPPNRSDENTLYYITDIRILEHEEEHVKIQIVSHFPGTLIGGGGRIVKKLGSYLSLKTDTTLMINIDKSQLWD